MNGQVFVRWLVDCNVCEHSAIAFALSSKLVLTIGFLAVLITPSRISAIDM